MFPKMVNFVAERKYSKHSSRWQLPKGNFNVCMYVSVCLSLTFGISSFPISGMNNRNGGRTKLPSEHQKTNKQTQKAPNPFLIKVVPVLCLLNGPGSLAAGSLVARLWTEVFPASSEVRKMGHIGIYSLLLPPKPVTLATFHPHLCMSCHTAPPWTTAKFFKETLCSWKSMSAGCQWVFKTCHEFAIYWQGKNMLVPRKGLCSQDAPSELAI